MALREENKGLALDSERGEIPAKKIVHVPFISNIDIDR